MAMTSPTPEARQAFYQKLATAYASIDAVKTRAETALDATEAARDAARALHGTADGTGIFNAPLGDLNLIVRLAAHAISELPALDDGEEEDSEKHERD
jgi:hypothetical protein